MKYLPLEVKPPTINQSHCGINHPFNVCFLFLSLFLFTDWLLPLDKKKFQAFISVPAFFLLFIFNVLGGNLKLTHFVLEHKFAN